MAVNIDLSSRCLEEKKDNSYVQYVPCKIEYDGSANIDKFFSKYVREDEQQEGDKGLSGSLRGHPLKGTVESVPEGYTGLLLRETQPSVGQTEGRSMRGVALFDSFTFWNWDRQPSRSDKYQQALDWLEVANVIHGTKD